MPKEAVHNTIAAYELLHRLSDIQVTQNRIPVHRPEAQSASETKNTREVTADGNRQRAEANDQKEETKNRK